MTRRIAIIQGHPDPAGRHFCHALAEAYAAGAQAGGHELKTINVAEQDIPLLHDRAEWESAEVSPAIRANQEVIAWADHLVIVYPLWLGSMPAMLKAFLEQVLRPGFAFGPGPRAGMGKKLLKGKSARIVVTMGMPAFFYRLYYRAHSLKSLERNILAFLGIGPIRASLIGMAEGGDDARREKWLQKLTRLGRQGC
ncbi:MAG: NAD(P)H-dependent oxidoreductase [Gammaproteobacteria bacterium]|jgi:putative NADPH-quinone reductase